MIDLVGVSKTYETKNSRTEALKGVDLEIKSGELVALLGPSGCGKTTTLMIIAGFLNPDFGEIHFNGELVNTLPPKDRNIGMVFQSYALYPHLSVIDNIAFPLKYKKVSKAARHAQAEEVAKTLQIEELLQRKPSQLSGGQQQRVAMARALVKKPVVLLLDEPMSNLDTRLKLDVRDEIRILQKQIGVTTILVTHDQEEAMAMADRVAILDKGSIQQFDSPDRLYYHPRNLFVANFLGNPPMNIVQGTIKLLENDPHFSSPGLTIPCLDRWGITRADAGKDVCLGVRPDHLRLSEEGSSLTLAVKAELVEHLGGKKLIKAVLGDKSNRSIRFLSTDMSIQIREGDLLELTAEDKNLHLFDMTRDGLNLNTG